MLFFSNSNFWSCFQAVFWRDVSLQLPDGNRKHTQSKKPAERAVVSCKLITSHSINKPIWRLSAALFTRKVLPVSCWRVSFCEQCYVKELPLGTVEMSGSPLCLLWFRDSQRPWHYRQVILSTSAMQPTSAHPGRIGWGPAVLTLFTPTTPAVFIGNDTKWPCSTNNIHTHKYAPLLREKIGWSNFWAPT